MEYVKGPLIVPFAVLQFGVGSLVPLLVLTFMIWRGTTGRALVLATAASAFLVLLAVLMMRWNVVIGGQELSKTMHGLIYFSPPFLGREGLLAAMIVFTLPFGMLWVLTRLFPPWVPNQSQLPAK